MTNRREAFLPLFFGDFLAATAEWSGEERALYLLLLGHSWSLGSIPVDPEKVCRLSGWDRKLFMKCWLTVAAKFKEQDGRLINARLEEHRAHAQEVGKRRAEAGSKGGSKRAANSKLLPSNSQANAAFLLKHQSIHSSEDLRSSGAEPPTVPESGAPIDPKKALWDIGVAVLGESNRAVIGKACKRVGEPRVAEVLGQMAADPKADPVAWFIAATSERKRGFVC